MDGVKDFQKTQIGPEIKNGGNAGTAVAATWLWRGVIIASDDSKREYPNEGLARLMPSTRNVTPMVMGSLKQGPDALTFEELPYILNASVRCLKKGIKDGAGSGYIRTYTLPLVQSDLVYTAATISFTQSTKTIADSGDGLAFVKTGDLIRISGSTSNDGFYTVATGGVAGSIVVDDTLVNESATATITIEVMTQVYTVENGNNKRVNRSTFCFPTDWEIAGQGGPDADFYKLASNWVARQWAAHTGFTALNPVAVSTAYFGNTKFYIDAINGTIGTTEKTNTLAGFKLNHVNGLGAKFSGNGYTYFGSQGRKAASMSCNIQMWHNDTALAEIDHALSGTPRLLRILIEGPTLTTGGTTYTKKSIILNLPGTWEPVKNLEDLDGFDMVSMVFRPAWDPTAGAGPSIVVVNEIADMA